MVCIWQSLKAGGLPDSEVAHRAIILDHHVLAAWHAVIASLKSLGGLIKRAAGVPRINAGTVLEPCRLARRDQRAHRAR